MTFNVHQEPEIDQQMPDNNSVNNECVPNSDNQLSVTSTSNENTVASNRVGNNEVRPVAKNISESDELALVLEVLAEHYPDVATNLENNRPSTPTANAAVSKALTKHKHSAACGRPADTLQRNNNERRNPPVILRPPSNTALRWLRCPRCGRTYRNEELLADHLKKHELGYGNYKCIFCNLVYCNDFCLTIHYQGDHEIDPRNCEICGKSFVRCDLTLYHSSTHSHRKKRSFKNKIYEAL